jgi:hypothetical protein
LANAPNAPVLGPGGCYMTNASVVVFHTILLPIRLPVAIASAAT